MNGESKKVYKPPKQFIFLDKYMPIIQYTILLLICIYVYILSTKNIFNYNIYTYTSLIILVSIIIFNFINN